MNAGGMNDCLVPKKVMLMETLSGNLVVNVSYESVGINERVQAGQVAYFLELQANPFFQ